MDRSASRPFSCCWAAQEAGSAPVMESQADACGPGLQRLPLPTSWWQIPKGGNWFWISPGPWFHKLFLALKWLFSSALSVCLWLCCLPLARALRNARPLQLSPWCPEIAEWQDWPQEGVYSGVTRCRVQPMAQNPTRAHVITAQTNGLLGNTRQHPPKLCYLWIILHSIPRRCKISGLWWVFQISSQQNSKQLLKQVYKMCLE